MTAIVYIACALVWGTTWFAIRRCIGLGGYPTFASAALRFAIAATIVAAAYALGVGRPGPRTARHWRGLLVAGFFSAVSYALVYAAEESISGGMAAVIFGTFPLFTALVATFWRVEKVTRAALAGSIVALVGIAVVFADRLDVSRAQAVGILLVLGAVLASAIYTTILKQVASDVSPFATTGVFLGTAAVVLGGFARVFERRPIPWPPPVGPTIALLYLAVVGSVLVFGGYFFLLKRVTLMTISMLVLIEPVVALAVDAIWEDSVVLVPRTYLGIAITFAGVAVNVVAGARARRG